MRSGRLVRIVISLDMLAKALTSVLLCCSILGADSVGTIVSAEDNKQYKVVKAERKLANGAIEIAEYVIVGDASGVRYAKRLTANGTKPSFYKIQGQ